MKDLRRRVTPRADVLRGELTEARFAASLDEVVTGSAPDAYGDADAFFAATYPSGGLKSLLNETLGRLGGGKPDGASVTRLETNLGGGKTHNLIALFHAASGRLTPARAAEFMDVDLLPAGPVQRIGVFVGTSTGAQTFPVVDGVSARTVWGYLALQLGGQAAYNIVRADDDAATAPGSQALKQVLGAGPALVLVDEIARYYSVARGVRVGDSTLAAQTTAFLMALMEAVDGLPHAVLVITTTEVTDAFGSDTAEVLEAISEARSLMARKELVLRPSDEADLPRILARRLFESIPAGAAGEVAAEYTAAADHAATGGLELPEAMTGAGWATEIGRTYPFHPSLVRVLDKRLSTIPNFQRTRGALRLLARVIRRLWDAGPAEVFLIHLHHVDLSEHAIAEDLSSRLERPAFEPVIRVDVTAQAGAPRAHAEDVDARLGGDHARRLATAIYLYSLTREAPGVGNAEAFGAVLTPGDDGNVLQRALDGLVSACWYLHADMRGLRFSTEASLVKLIQEAEHEISVTRTRAAATDILTDAYRDAALKVRRTWLDSKVPDSSEDASLVVLHWDEFGDARGVDPAAGVPDRVRQLWDKTPSGGIREYRNRVVLLTPSLGSHDAMVRAVRTHLALQALDGIAATTTALTTEKQAELRSRSRESALLAKVAVCNHVNLMWVPVAGGLDAVELDIATQSSAARNQTDTVQDRLAAMEKTLAAGDKPLDPGYVRTKLGVLLNTPQPTEELVRAFARRTDLKMVLDQGQLRGLVTAGVRNGVWEYQDPERGADGWATKAAAVASIRLSEETFLHPVGSAPPPPVQTCPFCGGVHPGQSCPSLGSGGGAAGPISSPAPGTRFTGSGAAATALREARSSAAEAGRHQVTSLTMSVQVVGRGTGTELAKLQTVVPATSAGGQLVLRVDLAADLDGPGRSASFRFIGTPTEWAPLREAVRQLATAHEAVLTASVSATFKPALEISGDAVERMVRTATDTGPSTCSVELTTEGDG